MGTTINWIITLLYGDQLLRCALQVERKSISESCVEYPMEPECREVIHALLPAHVQSLGKIVSIEEIFEIVVIGEEGSQPCPKN